MTTKDNIAIVFGRSFSTPRPYLPGPQNQHFNLTAITLRAFGIPNFMWKGNFGQHLTAVPLTIKPSVQ